MSTRVWYLNEEDNTESGYTEFNPVRGSRPVRQVSATGNAVPVRNVRTVRRPVTAQTAGTAMTAAPAVRTPAKAAKRRAGKKRTGIKVFFFSAGILAVALTAFIFKDDVVKACTDIINGDFFVEAASDAHSSHKEKKVLEEAYTRTEECASYDRSDPAYEMAESIMATLKRDNDADTAWEIFNWVHSNVWYQTLYEPLSFEEAAYRGFSMRSGDCYVSFACAKMLLDCAGIPNLMVERDPVITNSHYWNLVKIDGEWYHCDATEFKDHPDMYFLCTDDEINDEHHSFDHDLYPERASSYYGGSDDDYGLWFDGWGGYDEWSDDGVYYPYEYDGVQAEDYYSYEYDEFQGEDYYPYVEQPGEAFGLWEDQY